MLLQFHNLIRHLETSIVTSVEGVTLSDVEVLDKALFPITWDALSIDNKLVKLFHQLNTLVTSCLQHLCNGTRWTCGFSTLHLTECYSDHISGDCGRVTRDWGSIGQLVIGPIKFNAHESTMVLIPGLHLSLFCEGGFTCVIPDTLFTNHILVSFGHLPCDAVYCAPLWINIPKNLSSRSFRQPYLMSSQVLSILVGCKRCSCLRSFALLPQGPVGFEVSHLRFNCHINSLIPPPSLFTPPPSCGGFTYFLDRLNKEIFKIRPCLLGVGSFRPIWRSSHFQLENINMLLFI